MAFSPNQGLILPDGTDNANVPLTFTDFVTTAGSGMENRLVQRYLSIPDRTARNPAPNEGEVSYLSDLNRYDTYTGSAWVPLIPTTVTNVEATGFTGVVSTSYTTAGAPLCGVATTVPLSGQIRADWSVILDNTLTTGISLVSPQLNAGSVVGAGALIVAAADAISVRAQGQDEIQTSSFWLYQGLTPGADVNAFLNHRVTAGAGAFNLRRIILSQA